MKKIINAPERFIPEMLEGIYAAHPDELMCVAFVRSHNNGLKGQKVTSREMMSISDLEKLTGHAFFTNVSNAPKNTYNPSDWGL